MGNAVATLVDGRDAINVAEAIESLHDRVGHLKDAEGNISAEDLRAAFGCETTGDFSRRSIADVLADTGISVTDPRLRKALELYDVGHDGMIDSKEELESIRGHSLLINRALNNDLIIPDFRKFKEDVHAMYNTALRNRSGANADYIPQLSEQFVDKEQFGVGVCTIDGQRHSIGDATTRFGIQSISKAISYCIAQEQHGAEKLHQHVGMEPSGRPFNDMCLDERAHKADIATKNKLPREEAETFHVRPAIPHNPMINAGAIMTVSTLWRSAPQSQRFSNIVDVWNDLVGFTKDNGMPSVQFANAMYLSEASTAARNYCLAYMMQEAGAYMQGTNLQEALDLYFMCCSLELTCEMMSIVAATLANGGVNPLTGKRIFSQPTVKNALSLMASCGMYDYSGQFAFTMGFPAKSGVGGGIMVVIPGVMGICTFSPRLDEIGNSARGVSFCHELSKRFAFHNYDSLTQFGSKTYPAKRTDPDRETEVALLWAASVNDCMRLTHLLFRGFDVNWADYDKRTALHLAAACGHLEATKKLIHCGADPNATDRFGATALDDARRARHDAVIQFLEGCTDPLDLDGKDQRLLALGSENGSTVRCDRIRSLVVEVGLLLDDKRLAKTIASLPSEIDSSSLDEAIADCSVLERALGGQLVLQNHQDLQQKFTEIYKAVQPNTGGSNADYIPALAKQDPNKWGVAACSVDGQRISIGDTSDQFCVQSCSKAITYCIALAEKGQAVVNAHIGREPSGRPFNALVLDERVTPAIPHNPCINAGAIMSCALVQSHAEDSEDRVAECMDNYWRRLAGKSVNESSVRYDRATYKSESSCAERNRCLAYLMSGAGSFPSTIKDGKDLMETLEFYFKCCSILQDADSMAVIAATLANGGVCPLTNDRIFDLAAVRDCLSLVSSCGMYDFSGEFAFKIGFPSKSGVAGALLVVIPNVLGICTWSPPLDSNGNSVRGIDFCERISKELNFHIYDRLPSDKRKLDPTIYGGSNDIALKTQLIEAAAKGDLASVKVVRSIANSQLLSDGDYDNRTAFHLACAEGHVDVVKYLVREGVNVHAMDRWGKTGFDDANANNTALLNFLNTLK